MSYTTDTNKNMSVKNLDNSEHNIPVEFLDNGSQNAAEVSHWHSLYTTAPSCFVGKIQIHKHPINLCKDKDEDLMNIFL